MDLRARLKPLEKLDDRATAEVGCICFPTDEPPDLQLKAEVESPRSVLCPLHGERFAKVAPAIWRVIDLPAHLNEAGWKRHSAQYIRAMKASFRPDRFPAARVEEHDGSIRFVLKDGLEIHPNRTTTRSLRLRHRQAGRTRRAHRTFRTISG